jgi:hypothetical protein
MDFNNLSHSDADALMQKGLIQPDTYNLLKSKLGPDPSAVAAAPPAPDASAPVPGPSVLPTDLNAGAQAGAPQASLASTAGDWLHDQVKGIGDNFGSSPIMQGVNAVKDFGSHAFGISSADAAVPPSVPGQAAGPEPLTGAKLDPSQVTGAPAPAPSAVAGKGDLMENRLSSIEHGYGAMENAVSQGAAEGAKVAAAHSTYLDQMAKETQARNAVNLQHEAERQDFVKGEMTKLGALNDDVSKTASIDPNHYWNHLDTGNKISAGIALVLGGFAGGLSQRGGNAALDVINGAIQRDFESQKLDAQKAQSKYTNQSNLVSMMRGNFSDQRSADAAALAQMYNVAQIKANQFAVQAQSGEAKSSANRLNAELEIKKNEQLGTMQNQLMQFKALSQAATGGGIANPAILAPEQQKLAVRMPGGNYRLAGSEEGAKELNTKQIGASSIADTVQKLKELSGRSIPGTDRSAMVNALRDKLVFDTLKFHGISRLSKEDKDLVDNMTANVAGLRQDRAGPMLDQYYSGINNDLQNTYRQHIPGFKPIQEVK